MRARAHVWREAVTLPWLLMGVAAAAAVRVAPDGGLRIVPPPLSALVIALLMLALLVRCGQLAPAALVGGHRRVIENATGTAVLLALGWATAGIVALVIPEAGVPKLAGLVLLTALLANTLAAAPRREAALRALFVACLAGFVVKFIVLDALRDPTGSLGGRLLAILLDGVTLGTIAQQAWAPSTGYLAFATLLAYFFALLLLPRAVAPGVELSRAAVRTDGVDDVGGADAADAADELEAHQLPEAGLRGRLRK